MYWTPVYFVNIYTSHVYHQDRQNMLQPFFSNFSSFNVYKYCFEEVNISTSISVSEICADIVFWLVHHAVISYVYKKDLHAKVFGRD